MASVTGATPKTSPFQSISPPGGLVSMRMSMGVGKGTGSGRQTTAGLWAAHEQSNAARARMDAGLRMIIASLSN